MHVADGVLALLGIDAGHDEVSGAALVGGLNIGHAKDILNGCFQTVEAFGACVGLVAHKHRCPLVLAHGAGAAVGDAVDVDVTGLQAEGVVLRFL